MSKNTLPTVMVVDDEGAVLNLIALLLKREGFSVLTSRSTETALKMLDQRFADDGDIGVDCILCDWKMPGWDGLRFLAELRTRSYGQDLPFLLMSGVVSPDELEDAAAESANGILVKPIDQKTLMEKVKKAVDLTRFVSK